MTPSSRHPHPIPKNTTPSACTPGVRPLRWRVLRVGARGWAGAYNTVAGRDASTKVTCP